MKSTIRKIVAGAVAMAAVLAISTGARADSAQAPVITEVRAGAGGTLLHVFGANFSGGTPKLTLGNGGIPLAITLATSTQIDALLPAGVPSGSYLLTLTISKSSRSDDNSDTRADEFWLTIGTAGPAGAPGKDGTNGPTGQQGPAGPKGDTGPQGTGTVTSVATGAGLTGGPITLTGTIDLASTQLLPTVACVSGQVPQWSGMAWVCTAVSAAVQADVAGNLVLPESTSVTVGNIMKAGTPNNVPFIHNYGTGNTFIGENAGNFAMNGIDNTASGFGALPSNTSGGGNTAIGAGAAYHNATGSTNVAIGLSAFVENTSGSDNVAIGNQALNFTNGNNNIAIGAFAGHQQGGGDYDIYIGNQGVSESNTIRIGDTNQTRAFISGIRDVATGNADALPVVIDSNGQLGTGAGTGPGTGSGGGTVTSVATGTGLTGGPITSAGTISIANQGVGTAQIAEGAVTSTKLVVQGVGTSQLADASVTAVKLSANGCTNGQVLQYNSTAWVCAAVSGTGTVTSVATGAGLTGGPITLTGTIDLANTQLLPTVACAASQVPQWNGTAWACTTVSVTAQSNITGNLVLPESTSVTVGNIMKAGTPNNVPFIHNYGTGNTFIGENAGNFAMNGIDNTASGFGALPSNTSGGGNTAIGAGAAYHNATGSTNVAIGLSAFVENTSGSDNVAIGNQALNFTNGNNNIAIGAFAGHQQGGGDYDIYIGNQGVSESNTIRIGDTNQTRAFISGIRDVATGNADALPVVIDSNGQLGTGTISVAAGGIGTTELANGAVTAAKLNSNGCTNGQVMQYNGSAWTCSTVSATVQADAVGNLVLPESTSSTVGNIMKAGTPNVPFIHNYGTNNAFFGENAGNFGMTGGANTGAGYFALRTNQSGGNNTAIGTYALQFNWSGANNVAIGANALINTVTGHDNIALGSAAGADTTGSNNISIGNLGLGGESNTIRLGDPLVHANTFVAGNLYTSGAVNPPSDVSLKTEFRPVDAASLLDRLRAMPIRTWRYKTDPKELRHIGPTAQDFASAFAVGVDDKHIATVDADGVALAAIQGLHQLMLEKDAKIASQDAEIAELKKLVPRIAVLEQMSLEFAELKTQTARMAATLSRIERAERFTTASR